MRHGPHQVAQMSRMTTLPRKASRLFLTLETVIGSPDTSIFFGASDLLKRIASTTSATSATPTSPANKGTLLFLEILFFSTIVFLKKVSRTKSCLNCFHLFQPEFYLTL